MQFETLLQFRNHYNKTDAIIRNIGDEINVEDAKKPMQKGFGIALTIIGAIGALLAATFLAGLLASLPLIAIISIGVVSAAAIGVGIYLTIRGFESEETTVDRVLIKHFTPQMLEEYKNIPNHFEKC